MVMRAVLGISAGLAVTVLSGAAAVAQDGWARDPYSAYRRYREVTTEQASGIMGGLLFPAMPLPNDPVSPSADRSLHPFLRGASGTPAEGERVHVRQY